MLLWLAGQPAPVTVTDPFANTVVGLTRIRVTCCVSVPELALWLASPA